MSDTYEAGGSPSQPKAKRGCLGTSLIILGIVAGLCMLVCCGGGAFLYYKFRGVVKSEPAEILAVQEKIVGIDIPEDLRPAFALDIDFFSVFSMQWAIFGDQVQVQQDQQADGQGQFRGRFLVLMQMQATGEDQNAMEVQLRNQANSLGVNIDIEERETKTVEIAGEQIEFEFAQGTNREDDSQVRVVNGVFPSRGGVALLMMVVPEEQWNEWEAMTLLQSIQK